MNITTVKALVRKEIKQIRRDVSNILVAIVMPALILAIFGYGMSFDIKNIRVDIVQQDSGKIANDLVDSYVHSEYFDVNVVRSSQEAGGHMESGRTMGTIFVPENFSKNVSAGRKAEVQVVSDGTDPNTAAYIEAYASGIFHRHISSLAYPKDNRGGMRILDRLWFNPTTGSINFLMAGALTMIISIVGTFLTSLVIAKEWERGTMEAIIATPVSIGEIIVSKVIPYFGLCLVSLAFSLIYGKLAFNSPFEGSILAMLLVSSIFITVSLLIGILISTSAKDQFVAAMGAVTVTFLPTFMLSGFVFEISSMPLWLQFLSYIFPAKYYVSSVRTICMAGDIWEIIVRDSLVLGAMAAILLWLLKKKLRKNVE
ncbi:MAG: ABC transporter permease [Holosporales bacterium]|jgi:ABC-2 type transport system permease protein|nr:ABC transporter permease [Holosporales bacterium]